jgi:hypothetical protein
VELRDDRQWTGMPVGEFLDLLVDAELAPKLSALIESCDEVGAHVRATTDYEGTFPILYMERNDAPTISTGDYFLRISPSFFLHCLNLASRNVSLPTPDGLGRVLYQYPNPYIPTLIAFQWSIAHEYYHTAYEHQELVARHPHQFSQFAVERDADLCAVGVVVRLLEARFKSDLSSALELRIFVLHWIFWHLRLLSPTAAIESSTHTPIPERLISMAVKLVQLPLTRQHAVDKELSHPDTRARIQPIFQALTYFETEYLQAFPNQASGPTVFSELEKFGDPRSISFQITELWQIMDNNRRYQAYVNAKATGQSANHIRVTIPPTRYY